MRTRLRRTCLATLAAVVAAASVGVPAGASRSRTTLSGSQPRYAQVSPRIADVPGGTPVAFDVVLGLRDPDGASALATSVSDPADPSFRRFVSAPEFRRRFSWRVEDIESVVSWLEGEGLAVAAPSQNGVLIPVSGTAEGFEDAFGSDLAMYRVAGEPLMAPVSPLSVPEEFAGIVQGTIGIPEVDLSTDLAAAAGTPVRTPPAGPTTDPGPPPLGFGGIVQQQPPPPYCSTYWAESVGDLPEAYGQTPLLGICGYSARQIRSAYGVQKMVRHGFDGDGVDIGIVTAYVSPTLQDDLDGYSDLNGIPRTRIRITQPGSYTPAGADDIWDAYTEQTLDVQVSHGMAPGARIHYAGPDGLGEALEADNAFVDANVVDVISNSWGGPEVGLPAAYVRGGEAIFTQAAAQGITMLYSSGDHGDGIDWAGIRTVQYPSSSPKVTGVGGTTLAMGPLGNRMWEQAWGESATPLNPAGDAWDPAPPGSFLGGSTGGTSRIFNQPGYQHPVVPEHYWSYFGGRARVVPDVGLIGDPMSGPMLVQTAVDGASQPVVTTHNVGGTSVASPVFAGAVAVMIDRNGGRLGFLNPALYRMGGPALRDVGPAPNRAVAAMVGYTNYLDDTAGFDAALITGGEYATLRVRDGYDDVTGLGSPYIPRVAGHLRTHT